MAVLMGNVATFPDPRADKVQAIKVLEECAEVYSAWEMFRDSEIALTRTRDDAAEAMWAYARKSLVDECADLVQALCNLVAGLGVEDMTGAMEDCRRRNEERGRL